MKTLILIRHAKSSWQNETLLDVERPLRRKGEKRTKLIAQHFNNIGLKPDIIVTSHAERARQTAFIVAETIGFPKEDIVLEKGLYDTSVSSLNDFLYGIEDNHDTVMIFGHNPELTQLANQFISKKIDWLPTSGAVSVSFDCEKWNEIPSVKVIENFIIFPKMIKKSER